MGSRDAGIAAGANREPAVCAAFASLTASVTEDLGPDRVVDTLSSACARLLPIDSTEVFLPGVELERHPAVAEDGPALESFETGKDIAVHDLSAEVSRWPGYVARMAGRGYAAVSALPLRTMEETVGSIAFLSAETAALSVEDRRLGRALADVATLCLLQQRELRHYRTLSEQLQKALDSRVVIEQAKGMLAERAGVDLGTAFHRMRSFARSSNKKLSDVARGVVEGTLDTRKLLRPRSR
ncbi:GAF and ANTAR domain-containing protein [Amycolatopsis sp. EV170708-02-1]|uniref:GAF and ANTAR domain-containing protein n=1 Tax=Amycolatopsis sp. EV170708-02-1 TaxID=2919322 RepID=UPI001F0C2E1F|nr:GAF and ANTAR domain-containing protein [Amycolatopsis sp. EV170708-02-1]UMP04454.1 GAF and ANTAR domain-containing protein [Amycolatopsis sp. EV170708-02-1]